MLDDENIYQLHPNQLEKDIRVFWGNSKYKATRFARTITADIATNTSLARYRQMGIEYLQFYAEIDDKTTPQCRCFHGTIIPSNSRDIERYRPPLHQHCRSDILPMPKGYEIDENLLIENRDFTKHLDQDLKFMPGRVDQELVGAVFDSISTFNQKYRVSQFVLDDDIEKRFMKLNISVVGELPKGRGKGKGKTPGQGPEGEEKKKKTRTPKATPEKVEKTLSREEIIQVQEKKLQALAKEQGYLYSPDGELLFWNQGGKDYVSFTDEQILRMRGNILTHNHPGGTSFSPTDIQTSCRVGLIEVRATGQYRTYIMRMKDGGQFKQDLWEKKISDSLKKNDGAVRDILGPQVNKNKISPEQANLRHWHEVWTRVSGDVKEIEYTYIEHKPLL